MKPNRLKPTPSALKWMAERRARLAHDVALQQKVIAKLTRDLEKNQRDLAALDHTIQLYDPAIQPQDIEPVNGWQGNYGKRGALKAYIVDIIKSESPNWVSTDVIRAQVIAHFGLWFEHSTVEASWKKGSFRGTLKKLCSDGLIEREHEAAYACHISGRWRWKTESTTLAELERDDET